MISDPAVTEATEALLLLAEEVLLANDGRDGLLWVNNQHIKALSDLKPANLATYLHNLFEIVAELLLAEERKLANDHNADDVDGISAEEHADNARNLARDAVINDRKAAAA